MFHVDELRTLEEDRLLHAVEGVCADDRAQEYEPETLGKIGSTIVAVAARVAKGGEEAVDGEPRRPLPLLDDRRYFPASTLPSPAIVAT